MSSLRLSLAMLTKQAQDRIALKSALNGNKIPKQVGNLCKTMVPDLPEFSSTPSLL